MSFLKTGAGRWLVPAALAAVLATALLITPVIAGTKGVRNLSTSQTALGTLSLKQGSYDVRSTFDVRQNAAGANVSCLLVLSGVGQDQSETFTGTGTVTAQNSVAMELSGQAKAATAATLSCSSSAAADVNHAEITALKVPGVKTVRG